MSVAFSFVRQVAFGNVKENRSLVKTGQQGTCTQNDCNKVATQAATSNTLYRMVVSTEGVKEKRPVHKLWPKVEKMVVLVHKSRSGLSLSLPRRFCIRSMIIS